MAARTLLAFTVIAAIATSLTLYRPQPHARCESVQRLAADICYAAENPGTRIVRTYRGLPQIILGNGSLKCPSCTLFPSCGNVSGSTLALPIVVDKLYSIEGTIKLEIHSKTSERKVKIIKH